MFLPLMTVVQNKTTFSRTGYGISVVRLYKAKCSALSVVHNLCI